MLPYRAESVKWINGFYAVFDEFFVILALGRFAFPNTSGKVKTGSCRKSQFWGMNAAMFELSLNSVKIRAFREYRS